MLKKCHLGQNLIHKISTVIYKNIVLSSGNEAIRQPSEHETFGNGLKDYETCTKEAHLNLWKWGHRQGAQRAEAWLRHNEYIFRSIVIIIIVIMIIIMLHSFIAGATELFLENILEII